MSEQRISLDNGKYTVVIPDGGGMHALRYGESWRDLTGDNLVYFLAVELAQERARANAASGLAEALEYIANPVLAMQKQLKPGERLDGIMAVHLSESHTHLREVANKALAAWREVCGGSDESYDKSGNALAYGRCDRCGKPDSPKHGEVCGG